MADGLHEKKHAATPRRRQQARQQGRVAVSQDLTSAALLLSAVGAMWFFGGKIAAHLARAISHSLSEPKVAGFDAGTAAHWMAQLAGQLAMVTVPILILMMLGGVLMNLAQTGFILSPSRVTPKLSNISPRAGLGRVFSVHGVGRFGFGIFKVIVIAAVAYFAVSRFGPAVLRLGAMSVPQIAGVLVEALMGTCLWIGGALLLLAIADYGFQRWKYEKDLMMTDEELRQEMRESAGDPNQLDRRRELAREYAGSPINLRGADHVLVDPAGLAVAVRYDADRMSAPVVTAIGRQTGDRRIHAAAARQRTPIHTTRFSLTDTAELTIGRPIPPQLYGVVASILAKDSA